MRRLLGWVARLTTGVNKIVSHPVAFLIVTVQTLAWTVAVLTTHFDQHGFWFLYFATAVSYILLFVVAHLSLKSKEAAEAAEAKTTAGLIAIHTTMEVVHEIIASTRNVVDGLSTKINEVSDDVDDIVIELHDDKSS